MHQNNSKINEAVSSYKYLSKDRASILFFGLPQICGSYIFKDQKDET
jgi:hypothetical protein